MAATKPVDLSTTVREFWENHYRPKKNPQNNPGTRRMVMVMLNHLAKMLGREATLADLNDDTLTAFVAHLAPNHAPYSANRLVVRLCAIWRFAARKRIVDEWPDQVRLKEPHRIPEAWSDEELDRLFAACRTEPGRLVNIDASAWWTALHYVLLDTAERIGALLQVEWHHLSDDWTWLHVPAEIRKGRTGDEVYRLHDQTRAALTELRRQSPWALVFPWPEPVPILYQAYNRLLVRAGLPHDRKSKFHKMRRTVATQLEAAGHDACRALGHESRKVTERSYLDERKIKRPAPCEVMQRPVLLAELLRKGGGR